MRITVVGVRTQLKIGLAVALGVAGLSGAGGSARAQEEPPGDEVVVDTEVVPATVPLVEVPQGCPPWALADVVFVGTVSARDTKTVRFDDITIRSGDDTVVGANGTIDVRFGYDAQYMTVGTSYLIGASKERDLGILVSKLAEEPVDFAGDEIVGASEDDVICPEAEDPVIALQVDGQPVDYSLLDPFLAERSRLVRAILIPAIVAGVIVFFLAMLRVSAGGVITSLRDVRQQRRRRTSRRRR